MLSSLVQLHILSVKSDEQIINPLAGLVNIKMIVIKKHNLISEVIVQVSM